MGFDATLVITMSVLWIGVGVLSPIAVPKSDNRGLVRCMLSCTSVCMYIFWLCTYMAQMNPLLGPLMENSTLISLSEHWTPHQKHPNHSQHH